MDKYFIEEFNFTDKKVIIRVDWNIPTKNNEITDDFRIISSLPTIFRILADNPLYVVIISHFGRPDGKTPKYSWSNYLDKIQTYFKEPIYFLKDGLHQNTLDILLENKYKIYLLENIRFHNEETEYLKIQDTENDVINIIQKLGNFFVNDAFGCMHRNHLSICGIKTSNKAYGYLVHNELKALELIMNNKENKKIMALIGGAKVHDKLPLLENLSKKMDTIYVGGGNINGILKDKDMNKYICNIMNNKAVIHLMCDGLSSTNLMMDKNIYYFKSDVLPINQNFYDIGYESLNEIEELIQEHDIIFWNGTMGVVEDINYVKGTYNLVNLLIKSKKQVIIGGGDTAGYINKFNHNFYFISTGGGALIDYISNNGLVGLEYFC